MLLLFENSKDFAFIQTKNRKNESLFHSKMNRTSQKMIHYPLENYSYFPEKWIVLAGKMNWFTIVLPHARPFLQRLFILMKLGKSPHQK